MGYQIKIADDANMSSNVITLPAPSEVNWELGDQEISLGALDGIGVIQKPYKDARERILGWQTIAVVDHDIRGTITGSAGKSRITDSTKIIYDDDLFNGKELYIIDPDADNYGEHETISDFNGLTGEFIVDTEFPNNHGVGDQYAVESLLYELERRKYLTSGNTYYIAMETGAPWQYNLFRSFDPLEVRIVRTEKSWLPKSEDLFFEIFRIFFQLV